jgi:hypothetical protein
VFGLDDGPGVRLILQVFAASPMLLGARDEPARVMSAAERESEVSEAEPGS